MSIIASFITTRFQFSTSIDTSQYVLTLTGKFLKRQVYLRPKTVICMFQVSSPYLGFAPDPKHFIANCKQNIVKYAKK